MSSSAFEADMLEFGESGIVQCKGYSNVELSIAVGESVTKKGWWDWHRQDQTCASLAS